MAETSSYSSGPHPFQRRYPPELRERAVRMVHQAIEESGERFGVITRVARQLGIGTESLRSWVRQVEVDQGQRPGTRTQDKERIAALERAVCELGRSNEILRTASAFLRPSSTAGGRDDPLHRYLPRPVRGRADLPDLAGRPVQLLRGQASTAFSSSGERCRAWPQVLKVWTDNYRVYGARKQLQREGVAVGRDRVARLLRTLGIAGSCGIRPAAPRSRTRSRTVLLIWSSGGSSPPALTSCG